MDKAEKSGNGGVKKRKLSTKTESDRWLRSSKIRQGDIGQIKISSEKAEMDTGKGKKRKFSMEETPSKRRLRSDRMETGTEENGGLPIFNLPGELLTKIIDLVPISQWPSLESVSRSFQEVVHGLWGHLREIRMDEFVYNKEKGPFQVVDEEKKWVDSCQVLEAVLKKFLIRAPNLTSISDFALFCNRGSIRPQAIQLLSNFQLLQTIDFSGGRVVGSGDLVAFLVSSASRQCWKRLNIIDGIHRVCPLVFSIMAHKAGGNKTQPAINLESLKCNMEYLRLFDGFLPIQWSVLKKLVFVDTFYTAKEVLLIIRQCTQLAHLAFPVPKCGNGTGKPSYGEFMQGVADLENLSVLKMLGYPELDDAFYDSLLVRIQDFGRRGITDMALVNFYCSHQIMDQMVASIIDHLPRLKSLELVVRNCTTTSLLRVANGMGQLETLKLYWNVVDGTVIRAIGANMDNLQCLNLYYPVANSADLTSLGNLAKLKELRILGKSIESVTIKTWARMGFGSCMETLELSLQKGISPKVVGGFFKIMPRLRWLKLTGCTWGILKAIVEFCPRLADLQLGYSSTFTPTRVQSIIDCCSTLKNLHVDGHSKWFPATLKVGKYRKITFKSSDVGSRIYGAVFGLPS